MAKAEEVKVEDQVETPVEGAEGLEEGAGGPESISLNDLQLLAQIVDLASQRGAYKPNEMEVVGRTYNRLDIFLQAITPKQEAPAEGTAPAQPTAPAQSAEAPKE